MISFLFVGISQIPLSSGPDPPPLDSSKQRNLTSNYRETEAKSQPSALETVKPIPGVTLRQGTLTKAGPVRPPASTRDGVLALLTMTRDEYAK